MPGLVGLITDLPSDLAIAQLRRMLGTLLHESFYVHGTYTDERLGVYVGWTALEDASASEMPVKDERDEITLVFSGEEFSDQVRAAMSTSYRDSEAAIYSYLIGAYKEDRGFPQELNGRFHGILLDRARNSVLLFNDRFAMHRLYIHQSRDGFYFAAEAKAILAALPGLKQINIQSLGEFVSCGAVLENRTLFADIATLPPASRWIFRNRALEHKATYFDARQWEEQDMLDPVSCHEEIRSVFRRSLPRYFEGRGKVGMSLTGGLDTRIIMAGRRPATGSLPCYTFGSMYRTSQDVRTAAKVAEETKQRFQVLTAGREFLAEFPRYAERTVFLTDGCVDVGRAPDLYLNEQARRIAPVRMTGLYGGEILRGVRAFKPVPATSGLFRPELLLSTQRAATTYARALECHPVSFAVFRQNPWSLYGSLSLEQTQLQVRTPFLDNDFLRTVFRLPAAELKSNRVSWQLIGDGALRKIPTDRGLTAERSVWSTARHAFLEFEFKAEYAYDMGMPQWLARLDHTFSSLHLERAILGHHKPFHFRVWYRDALADYVQEILLDSRSLSRPYIERRGVEQIVTGHLKGNRNYTTDLHKLLTLELIHRIFVDSDGFEESHNIYGGQEALAVRRN